MIFKTALKIKRDIDMIQKPFIDNEEILHSIFNFYLPQYKRKNISLITAVKTNLVDNIVVDYRMDFINHHFFMLLEIQELDPR